jgi:hypothetical protein
MDPDVEFVPIHLAALGVRSRARPFTLNCGRDAGDVRMHNRGKEYLHLVDAFEWILVPQATDANVGGGSQGEVVCYGPGLASLTEAGTAS